MGERWKTPGKAVPVLHLFSARVALRATPAKKAAPKKADPHSVRAGDLPREAGDVGSCHETFLVAGEYEAIYTDASEYGLGAAAEVVPASGANETAAGWLGRPDGTDAPVAEDGAESDGA
ncbi:MAG: hypothetical protein ABEJ23_06020 [Haloarculaceae archaeon]